MLTLLALGLALGGGVVSVWYALRAPEGVGSVTIGGWTTYPDMGTPDANPYSKARVAQNGLLALGRAEGLEFVAQRDANGDPLQRGCRYSVEGSFPPARIWTLHAIDKSAATIPSGSRMANSVNSQSVLLEPDNSVTVTVSSKPAPANWLPVEGAGPMSLVLILYDTPIASGTGLAATVLPRIKAAGCDG